jgi:hypothetical protein
MKYSCLLFAAALALCASPVSAAEPVTLTLADFTDGSGAKPGPGWVTEEGGIIHRTTKQGDLISVQDYTSFEIEWEWDGSESSTR